MFLTTSEQRRAGLLQAVTSLRAQTLPVSEIIVVVDNNPTLYASFHGEPELAGVVLVDHNGPRGVSHGRNKGVSLTHGSILAFLDDDVVAEPDWHEQLLCNYNDLAVAGVGGQVLPQWLAAYPKWFPEEFYWAVGCTYRGLPEDTAPVRNLIGANMSFRREVFESIGDFSDEVSRNNSNRPTGDDETELCIRYRQQFPDQQFIYEPKARVWHKVPATRTTWSYLLLRCYCEGLSKARLSRLARSALALASERRYVLIDLPKGLARGFVDFTRGDITGLFRFGAIIAGLAASVAGYGVESVRLRLTGGTALAWEPSTANLSAWEDRTRL